MSLSPKDYEDAVGEVDGVLIYLDGRLVATCPSGCDGWPLIERDGMIIADMTIAGSRYLIYPVLWSVARSHYVSGYQGESEKLYSKIQAFKKEYTDKHKKSEGY